MVNGIINVYKEKGFTSFDVVAKMRGIFHQKKIGHTGTLDPDAEGVLPVCLGKATRVCDMLTDKDKVYEAVLLLGQQTDTLDVSGQVLNRAPVNVTEEQVQEVIRSFTGEIMQVPPMYSALKVNGQKLCDLARKGITVERKARPVTIYEIVVTDITLPRVTMQVHCSKGTYIRTLCDDIGQALGCYGCMEALTRTKAAGFDLSKAYRLSEIEALVHKFGSDKPYTEWDYDTFSELLYPVDHVFMDYPAVTVKEEAKKLLYNGNRVPETMTTKQTDVSAVRYRIYDWTEKFIGLYAYIDEDACYKPVKLFME